MFRLNAKREYENRAKSWRFGEFIQLLSRSRSTLRILSIEMSDGPYALLRDLLTGLDYRTMPLVDLRLWEGQDSDRPNNVKITRRSPPKVAKQVSKEGIALQVLWNEDLPELLFGTKFILHNLVSLRIEQSYSAEDLHPLLKPLSPKLKHLNLFIVEDHWELEVLHFPKLEVLELSSNLHHPRFHQWISCPSSLKLGSYDIHQDLPSIAELSIETLKNCTPLFGRCPLLHTFRFQPHHDRPESLNLSNLVKLLTQRRTQVEAGMEVDGIKMQNIKTFFAPFCRFGGAEEELEQVKSLVETVIDSDGEQWEIII